jgi:hypothetical protein
MRRPHTAHSTPPNMPAIPPHRIRSEDDIATPVYSLSYKPMMASG